MDVPFFMVSRWDSILKRCQTVLKLRSQDVVSAEIQRDGVSTEFVLVTEAPHFGESAGSTACRQTLR